MISVIIPAHNEAAVIGECLSELSDAAAGGHAEIVVVCNGCTDHTADVVKKHFPQVTCLETEIPSKNNALNLGDAAIDGFPRIYVDADVILPWGAVQKVAPVLDNGDCLAAAPRFEMDFEGSSWFVRTYYDIWQRLPYVKKGMIGTGVYALSGEGRKRFDKFPDILADDGYVRALFKEHERTVVDDAVVTVRAPKTLGGLIKIKTRSRLGGYELFSKFPELRSNEEKDYGSALAELLPDVKLWPKIPIYLFVNLVARFRAKRQFRNMECVIWERDETSRDIQQ